MRKITADLIVPVTSPPIANGVVIVDDDGKILAVEADSNQYERSSLEAYKGIICPGLINAHCHLELSYMKNRLPEKSGLVNFIINILQARNDEESGVHDAIALADDVMYNEGIVAVGDISNGTASFQQKVKSKVRYHTFVECFGLGNDAGFYLNKSIKVIQEASKLNLQCSVTPHAPYSMSNQLFENVFSFRGNTKDIFSYHNQESEEENKLYRGEESLFDRFYREFKLPSTNYRNASGSLQAHLNFFPAGKKVLFVHNTCASSADVAFAMQRHQHLYWCFCPNANLYIENKLPDFQNFMAYNNQICIGTDSLASNHRLSVLEEMKTIQRHDASIGIPQLIQWATINAATFFEWDHLLGSIEEGKMPGLTLISDVDFKHQQFTQHSSARKLV